MTLAPSVPLIGWYISSSESAVHRIGLGSNDAGATVDCSGAAENVEVAVAPVPTALTVAVPELATADEETAEGAAELTAEAEDAAGAESAEEAKSDQRQRVTPIMLEFAVAHFWRRSSKIQSRYIHFRSDKQPKTWVVDLPNEQASEQLRNVFGNNTTMYIIGPDRGD